MKTTSIEANQRASKSGLKEAHKKKILNSLTDCMTGKEISESTGLDYHAVMRRMSELERDNKISCVGKKGQYSLYKKMDQLTIFDIDGV